MTVTRLSHSAYREEEEGMGGGGSGERGRNKKTENEWKREKREDICL